VNSPQRWEYKIEPIFNPIRAEAVLNSFADQGWRLAAVLWPGQEHQFVDPANHRSVAKGPWFILEREYNAEEEVSHGDPGD
jgi:hypothetical protein